MPVVNYKPASPWAQTKQSSWYLDRMTYRPIPPDGTDDAIIVGPEHHHRPDLLSHELYGTTDFWWVFMIRNINQMTDPIHDLKAGMTIMVPSRTRINKMF